MKSLVAMFVFSFIVALPCAVRAEDGSAPPTHEEVSAVKQFLFVQNASSGSYKNGRLSLAESGPVTFFSDRPYRIFGHTQTAHFIDAWGRGENSFAANPPNAVLSILGSEVASFGLVLSEPRYEEGVTSYRVTIESGTIPENFGSASLFIDNEFWAAVGGLAVGRSMARRQQRREEAAYTEGQAATTVQDKTTYYQASATPAASPEQELTELKSLHDKGLISDQEYNSKRQQIVNKL